MALFDEIFVQLDWKNKHRGPPPDDVKIKDSWLEYKGLIALKALGKMRGETKTITRSLYLYDVANTRKLAVVEGRKEKELS